MGRRWSQCSIFPAPESAAYYTRKAAPAPPIFKGVHKPVDGEDDTIMDLHPACLGLDVHIDLIPDSYVKLVQDPKLILTRIHI